MESASKALLIAAGVLMGILVLSLVLMLWANLSNYQANSGGSDKEDQLASFNQEFTQFSRNNVYGSDLISIVNKIESYNKNNPDFFNDRVQYEPIELSVNFDTGNRSEALSGSFTGNKTITNTRDDTYQMINKYTELEQKYGKSVIQKLSANRQRLKDKMTNDGMSREDAMKDIIGRYINISDSELEEYYEFTEFKTAKFNCVETNYNDRGQVNKMKFEFKGR